VLNTEKMTPDFCLWAFGVPNYEFKWEYLGKWNKLHPNHLLLYPMHRLDQGFERMVEIYEEEKKNAV
jgi:hypothetical protein